MNTKLYALGFTIAIALASNSAWAVGNYKFEKVSAPSGATIAVRLVDTSTEQPVINAHVYATHRQWLPPTKGGAPRFIDRRVELTPDGSGTFTYRSDNLDWGATLRLTADIAGGPKVEGSVRVNG